MRSSAISPPTGFRDFQTYTQASRNWIQDNRSFQTENQSDELKWNSPFELRPPMPSTKAILLVHGLGDSPWSFTDVARSLADQGYVVRTLLLPGHGTKPADLIGVRLEDWQRLVREQIILLQRDFPDVWLGGFSTGANLVLEHALGDTRIRGLVLFSPALRSNELFDWASPWLVRLRPWLLSPDRYPLQSPLRYHIVPTNGLAQFYRSSVAVRKRLKSHTFDRPAIIVLAEHDSVVDVHHVRHLFEHRFTHEASRLIWYGSVLPQSAASSRILMRTDALPQERISQFSHMGILFSPNNAMYGRDGSERICFNGQTDVDTVRCQSGAQVWYSDWDYREPGKAHARLTFNPYFDWQSQVIQDVLAANTQMAVSHVQ
jgi:esterase/lipase